MSYRSLVQFRPMHKPSPTRDPLAEDRIKQRYTAYVSEMQEQAFEALMEGNLATVPSPGRRGSAGDMAPVFEVLRDALDGEHQLVLLRKVLDALRDAARNDNGERARKVMHDIARKHATYHAQLQLECGAFIDPGEA